MKKNMTTKNKYTTRVYACLICFLLSGAGFFPLLAQGKQAVLELNLHREGEKNLITARAFEMASQGVRNPIAGLDLYFYVDRSFNPLPLGDVFSTTDDNGEATVEFPNDLPGDSVGNVKIIVRIQDSDTYAKTEVSQDIRWGLPQVNDHSENQRSLWAASANAPISLLLLVNGLIAAAWSLIIFIIIRIYQISRM